MYRFVTGDIAFLLESNRIIRKVIIVKAEGEFCLVRFTDTDGGIRVRRSRLYKDEKAATEVVNKFQDSKPKNTTGFRSPYEYEY